MRNTFPPFTNYHQPSTIFAWVKNVYSLCVEGVVNRVHPSPVTNNHLPSASHVRVQPTTSTISLTSFAPSLYTPNSYHLSPTNNHLSTLSTVPTIKKNKKK